MSGYKVEELYREIGEYKARIDVYITAQGYYEVTAVFLDNPGTKPLIKFVDRNKDKAIALALERLARILNRCNYNEFLTYFGRRFLLQYFATV